MDNHEAQTAPMAGGPSSTVMLGNSAGYSEQYKNAIAQAQAWFAERLPTLPEIHISRADFSAGTDALRREDLNALVGECFQHMLTKHKYELSYSQQCRAFFGAADALGRIHVA